MATCGNCGKTGATVAEIRVCYTERYGPITDVPAAVEITDGMWRMPDGTIYKVQRNLAKTGLYGKRLDVTENFWGNEGESSQEVCFVYEPGAIRKLREGGASKLTLEQAKEFGALYGTCCVCGRTLTNETSIEAGIGPICAGRLA